MELTKRQNEILELVAQGDTSEQIGIQLGISKRTVDAHRYNIILRLGASSKKRLLEYFQEQKDFNSLEGGKN